MATRAIDYRALYKKLSSLHTFSFKLPRARKGTDGLTSSQKSAITRAFNKYAFFLEKIKAGEMSIYRPQSRKVFRTLARIKPHSNKGIIFFRGSQADIRTRYVVDPYSGEPQMLLSWKPVRNEKTRDPLRIRRFIEEIPQYVRENYLNIDSDGVDILQRYLLAIYDKYDRMFPKNKKRRGEISLAFIHPNNKALPTTVSIEKFLYYGEQIINDGNEKDEDERPDMLSFTGILVQLYEIIKPIKRK